MNGIDEILKKIEDDSDYEIKKLISDAENDAKNYVSDETKKAKDNASEIIENAKKRADIIRKNAKSGYEFLIKKDELAKKSEITGSFLKDIENELKNLPEKEYFDLIKKLILKYAEKNDGELMLSEKDKKRMPKDFFKNVNDELKKDGRFLTLCNSDIDADGGFMIKYGEVYENCTFSALIEDNVEKIKDEIYKMLNA